MITAEDHRPELGADHELCAFEVGLLDPKQPGLAALAGRRQGKYVSDEDGCDADTVWWGRSALECLGEAGMVPPLGPGCPHPEGQWIVIDGRIGVGFDMEPHTWEDSCHGCTYFAPAAPLVEVCQSD